NGRVIIISVSVLFLIFIGIVVLLMFVVPAVLSDKYSEEDKKPYKISWAILGLLVFNWLLFLSNSYSLMPDSISDLIFTLIWVILSVAGVIVLYYEFNKYMVFAVSMAELTAIILLFIVLSFG